MAKKEEKKDEKKAKAPATPEQEAAAAKKKKIIIAAVAGLLVVGGGAFAAMKMLGKSSKHEAEPAKSEHGEAAEGHREEHGGEPVEGGAHGDAHGGAEGEAKGDAHGKSEGKAEEKDPHAAPNEHGEAPKEEHAKEGGEHGKADPHAAKPEGHGEGKEGASEAAAGGKSGRYGGIGLIYEMKPFHLNLGNPLENRYVRLEVRFEYPNEEQKAELVARDSQIRDAVVSIVSRKTREHLLSPDGKDQLRLEIKNRVNQYLEKKINNVYITDILIE